jgi:hypothetical protein
MATVFASLLLPFLFALFYFSTARQRQTLMFTYVVAAVVTAIIGYIFHAIHMASRPTMEDIATLTYAMADQGDVQPLSIRFYLDYDSCRRAGATLLLAKLLLGSCPALSHARSLPLLFDPFAEVYWHIQPGHLLQTG